jgi:hypothetical protein
MCFQMIPTVLNCCASRGHVIRETYRAVRVECFPADVLSDRVCCSTKGLHSNVEQSTSS